MKKIFKNKKFKIIVFFIIIIISFFILGYLSRKLSAQEVKDFVASFGILSPIILIIFCIFTTIFSPLVVTPFWIAGIKLFGYSSALVYINLANVIGHSLNFLIARKFGRPLVMKLVGKKGIKEIDNFSQVVGRRLLILLRIIGGPAADYISYASGFTNMKFLHFFIITTLFMIPWTVFSFWITYKAVENDSIPEMVKYFTLLGILTLLVSFVISILISKKMKRLEQKP